MGTNQRTAHRLSDVTLRNRKWKGADEWISDGGSRGAGRLVVKISAKNVAFYYAYFDSERRRRFYPIGPHDSSGSRGKTLQQARDEAARLSARYRSGTLDLHEHFAHERRAEADAKRTAAEAAKRAEDEARRSTLKELLDAYREHLERGKKQSAADVRRMFNAHVFDAWPTLSARRAADLSSEDLVPVLARLVEAGKGRTAGKLRSYMRAAYALALRSKTDPAAPLALRAFGIAQNPVASVGALSRFNRELHRTLSAEELRVFLARVDKLSDGAQKDALLALLHLGGQRPAQLLRSRPADVDLSAATLTLFDPKGSRHEPRRHVLPLTKDAAAILKRRVDAKGEYLFSSDGKRALRVETLSVLVTEIATAMVKEKKAREAFTMRDLRRTAETMLAALRVSRDVRAQLQSHGLGGVQSRHYDRHDYMDEKRAALRTWERRLAQIVEGKSGKVIPAAFGAKPGRS
jgi:integrase